MPINASFEYFEAEKKYLQAQSLEEKIRCLEDLIRKAPSHKGSENLKAELRTRLKKFKEKAEKGKKVGKGQKGIRKEGFQCALVGKSNSGKSALMVRLTNAEVIVSDVEYSTRQPHVGMMDYEKVKAQIVDLPSIEGKDFDYSIVNNADCLLIIVDKFDDFFEVDKLLEKSIGKKIYLFNKIDLLESNEKRKVEERCKSKRLNYVLVSAETGEGVNDLKKKIFEMMGVIRVFTKEPGKQRSYEPVVLKQGSCVRDVAETIYKGFSRQVRETRLTGPSGKFSNQKVGMNHQLKDKDVVEFHTR